VPVLLGRGVRLFEHPGAQPVGWAAPEVRQSPRVTHLRYHRPGSETPVPAPNDRRLPGEDGTQ